MKETLMDFRFHIGLDRVALVGQLAAARCTGANRM
jgi:hypothetical protein